MNSLASRTHTAIGLMSGTSADGVDVALVRIALGPPPRAEVLDFRSVRYPAGLRRRVLAAAGEPGSPTPEICSLHQEIGEAFAGAAMSLLEAGQIESRSVNFIGSHGQTVRHLPEGGEGPEGPLAPSTLQIGDPAVIAERTGCTVISDFRARDVAAGGMGAPLTPWAHRLLFGQKGRPVVFVNLGGISNLTYIPPEGEEGLFAFDAGPANMTLDALAEKISGGKEGFDNEGAMAARGRVSEEALASLLRHPYLAAPVPKSTGRETFGESFLAGAAELPGLRGAGPEDQMATMCAFSAECIVRSLRDHFPPEAPPAEIIAGGGGVRNKTFMARLEVGLAPIPLVSSAERGISPDEVEAVSFALLAWGTLRGEPGNVPAATGAKRSVVLGNITPGRNYLSLL
ncbi:MAG: anhydro-N-acetylmuramic acid kinase [Nitrospinota bacterium]